MLQLKAQNNEERTAGGKGRFNVIGWGDAGCVRSGSGAYRGMEMEEKGGKWLAIAPH